MNNIAYDDLPDDIRYHIFTFVSDYMDLSTSIIGGIFNPSQYTILDEPFNLIMWADPFNISAFIYIDKCVYTILYYIFRGKFSMIEESVYRFVHKNNKCILDLLEQRFPPIIEMYKNKIPAEMLSIYMFTEIIKLSFYATSVIDEMIHINLCDSEYYHRTVGFVRNIFEYKFGDNKDISNKEYYNMSKLIRYALMNPNMLIPDNLFLTTNNISLDGYYYQLVYYSYVFLPDTADDVLCYLLNRIKYNPDKFIELSIDCLNIFRDLPSEFDYRVRLIELINNILYINYDYFSSLEKIVTILNTITEEGFIDYEQYIDLFTLNRMYSILTDVSLYQHLNKYLIDEFIRYIPSIYYKYDVEDFHARISEFAKENINKRGYYDEYSELCIKMYISADKIAKSL